MKHQRSVKQSSMKISSMKISTKHLLAALGMATLATMAPAQGQSSTASAANTTTLSKGDQHILAQLAQANLAEVAAAQIALKKSQSADVKTFAQQMVDDHTKGLQAVQEVARNKNVTLPTEPDRKHKAMADRLNAMSGAAFDQAYLQRAGVQDHAAAHKLVADAQTRAKDADVKALAAKLQPTIDQHMQMVQALASAKSNKQDSGK
jgi:putative membrane protein